MATEAKRVAERARSRRRIVDDFVERKSIDLSTSVRPDAQSCWKKLDLTTIYLLLVGVCVSVAWVGGSIMIQLVKAGAH